MRLDTTNPPTGTVRDWIAARAQEGGVAFTFPDGEPDLTWADLQTQSRKVAEMLTARGHIREESVAIVMPNCRDALIAFFGTVYGGFKAVMINLVAGNDAISYALEHSEARVAFVHDSQLGLFKEAAKDDVEILQVHVEEETSAELHSLSADTQALLMYTSGTTGRPKGVVHTQASLLAGGWTTAVAHQLTGADRGYCVLPIYHINGLCVTVISTLVSGGSLAMCPKFSTSSFWSNAQRAEVTWFSVVPTIISHLLHSDIDPSEETKKRIRFGRSASAPLSPDVQRAFEDRFGMPIIETMGLTETAAQILSNPLPPGTRKIGSPGVAFGNEAVILSTTFEPVAAGEEGELAVRGPNVMQLYLKNTDATEDTFTQDGWMRTGDLARQDEDGYIFITGRLKELIIKGGENIAPREIDEALYTHPDVIEAAAFPQPCKTYGERVEAAVAVKEGSNLTEESLIEICRARLGKFKSPDAVYFLKELPKGPSGKIQRKNIADEVSAFR